jgi:hypothetical protein
MSENLIISLGLGSNRDLRHVEEASANLRSELRRINGVESVEPLPSGEAPAGARAVDAVSVSSLLVTLSASGGVLTSLIVLLKEWLGRSEKRGLVLQIGKDRLEISGPPSREQNILIETFLKKLRNGRA